MGDDDVLQRWLRLEMGHVNGALVTATRVLGDLAADVTAGERAVTRTRAGEEHAFDADAVTRLAREIGPLARRRLRVPVTFWVDRDLPDEASLADSAAAEALHEAGRLRREPAPPGERTWLALSLAHDIARSYPTLFQFAYH